MLYDCFITCTWAEVKERILQYYPDQKSNLRGYFKVFNSARALSPIATKQQVGMEAVEDNSSKYIHVFIIPFADEVVYAMASLPWQVIMGLQVADGLFEQYGAATITGLCLYEMTFFGFSEGAVNKCLSGFSRPVHKWERSRHIFKSNKRYFKKPRIRW